jgi:hypothetical protein
LWEIPILRALDAVEDIGGTYLEPSGPPDQLAVPLVHSDNTVNVMVWNGTNWSSSAVVPPSGGVYNWWSSLVPPSSITPIFGSVTGLLPQAWTNPLLSITSTGTGRFLIAGSIAGVPTLALYNSTLTNLSSLVLPGVSDRLAYNADESVTVSGIVSPGVYFLSIYTIIAGQLYLVKTYNYGVPITSISYYSVGTSTAGVTSSHILLLVTTNNYYLPGEVITQPGPVLTLATAPPGDIFLYDLSIGTLPIYTTPPPARLWSERYGGLLSGAYARRKGAIFALNQEGTVVSWAVRWNNNGVAIQMSPTSIPAPGATGIYANESFNSSQLIVYGSDRAVAYEILSVPPVW